MYQASADISNAHLAPLANTPGLIWSLLYQPIPRIVSDNSIANGGNILGLDRNAGNLIRKSSSLGYRSIKTLISKKSTYCTSPGTIQRTTPFSLTQLMRQWPKSRRRAANCLPIIHISTSTMLDNTKMSSQDMVLPTSPR